MTAGFDARALLAVALLFLLGGLLVVSQAEELVDALGGPHEVACAELGYTRARWVRTSDCPGGPREGRPIQREGQWVVDEGARPDLPRALTSVAIGFFLWVLAFIPLMRRVLLAWSERGRSS